MKTPIATVIFALIVGGLFTLDGTPLDDRYWSFVNGFFLGHGVAYLYG